MSKRATPFEEFIALFNRVKEEAKGDPRRVTTFYGQSQVLSDAADALDQFLWRSDFERRFMHGPRKFHAQVPSEFEPAWRDYSKNWTGPIAGARLGELGFDLDKVASETPSAADAFDEPEYDEHFDPRWDDGAAAIQTGLDHLGDKLSDYEDAEFGSTGAANLCRPALEAWDYLQKTIGIDVAGIFHRWRTVPVMFLPAHVSNRHGLTEKGSLFDLLDDAVRAYVAGAPAASTAMCRAALELVLREHYVRPTGEMSLDNLIDLAARRFEYLDAARLHRHRKAANRIMHGYVAKKLTAEDEELILDFLRNLKFLIQRAPGGNVS